MSVILTWFAVVAGMLFLGSLWVMYLIKVVVNDEDVQERIRRIRRQQEEERRALEDRIRKRREQQTFFRDGAEGGADADGASSAPAAVGSGKPTEA